MRKAMKYLPGCLYLLLFLILFVIFLFPKDTFAQNNPCDPDQDTGCYFCTYNVGSGTCDAATGCFGEVCYFCLPGYETTEEICDSFDGDESGCNSVIGLECVQSSEPTPTECSQPNHCVESSFCPSGRQTSGSCTDVNDVCCKPCYSCDTINEICTTVKCDSIAKEYDDLNACQASGCEQPAPMYSCVNERCVEDPSGPYTSSGQCIATGCECLLEGMVCQMKNGTIVGDCCGTMTCTDYDGEDWRCEPASTDTPTPTPDTNSCTCDPDDAFACDPLTIEPNCNDGYEPECTYDLGVCTSCTCVPSSDTPTPVPTGSCPGVCCDVGWCLGVIDGYQGSCGDLSCCDRCLVSPEQPKITCNVDTGEPDLDGTGILTAIGCIPANNAIALTAFILRWALGIGGGIAFILIIYSGFMITTSAGNPERVQAGKELLTAAIAGLMLIIFSVFLLDILGVRIFKLPGF